MARWDPGTEERLRQAAVELFQQHGYEHVTVTQIAERAGLTRRSFSRYFADKREVLFAGSDQLAPALAQEIADAGLSASPFAAVLHALGKVGNVLATHVKQAGERRAIIDASPELQERERTKLAGISSVIARCLEQRSLEAGEALVLAEVATVIFKHAFDRWISAAGQRRFDECLQEVNASVVGLRAAGMASYQQKSSRTKTSS